ncbi:MAG: TfoX/Sxy family protein [Geminicoccaceae bacterium]
MAFDQNLAGRVCAALAGAGPVREVRMFGGLVFMLRGHMCCGVTDDLVFVRLGAESASAAIAAGEARVFPPVGRRVTSMVTIPPAGTLSAAALQGWIDRAIGHVTTLPARG